jgi:hypothetical protein
MLERRLGRLRSMAVARSAARGGAGCLGSLQAPAALQQEQSTDVATF